MYIIIALFVVVAWGINSAIMKIGITDFPIFLFLSIRFLGTGLLFLPFSKLKKREIPDLFKSALSFNVLHISLISFSLFYLTASSSATIQQIQVPMAVLLSVIFLKERISFIQILGIIIAIMGVVVVYGIPEVNFIGFIFTILAAFFYGVSQLVFKKSVDIPLTTFVAYTSLFSVPFLIVLSFLFDEKLDVEKVNWFEFSWVMGFQILIMGSSTSIWQKIISYYGVNKVTPTGLLTVIFAILGGVILLDEKITYQMIIGATIIIMGVALTTFFKPKESIWKRFYKFIFRGSE